MFQTPCTAYMLQNLKSVRGALLVCAVVLLYWSPCSVALLLCALASCCSGLGVPLCDSPGGSNASKSLHSSQVAGSEVLLSVRGEL